MIDLNPQILRSLFTLGKRVGVSPETVLTWLVCEDSSEGIRVDALWPNGGRSRAKAVDMVRAAITYANRQDKLRAIEAPVAASPKEREAVEYLLKNVTLRSPSGNRPAYEVLMARIRKRGMIQ